MLAAHTAARKTRMLRCRRGHYYLQPIGKIPNSTAAAAVQQNAALNGQKKVGSRAVGARSAGCQAAGGEPEATLCDAAPDAVVVLEST